MFRWCLQKCQALSSFRCSGCITACITNCLLRLLHAAKTRPRAARGGPGGPHENFGGRKAAHLGAPPPLRVLLPSGYFISFHSPFALPRNVLVGPLIYAWRGPAPSLPRIY